MEGNALADKVKNSLKKDFERIREEHGVVPTLAAVQVGENPASRVYVNNQRRTCEDLGVNYQLHSLSESIEEKELNGFIENLNQEKAVHGIILQMPLPGHLNARKVQMGISPYKDAEGVHPSNMGMLVFGQPRVAPCTAMAVMEILQEYGIPIKGKETVVVGHSEIVGKPVTLFLLSSLLESATPTVCHIATRDLASHTRRAELLIVAVGKPGLIRGDMIKEGAVVVDVGINRIPVTDEKGNPVLNDKGKPRKRIVGDVLFEEAKERASYITPVPGGVGPLTVVMLLKNTLACCQYQLAERKR